jgi:uncharacterized zinc-type alcohol dehydrogenase-like protein
VFVSVSEQVLARPSSTGLPTAAWAAKTAGAPIAPFQIARREPGAHDVLVEILYCGVCHSDIHQARAEWGEAIFPMVPGHEIIGRVARVGAQVTKWKQGDTVGIGCFVDSCRECEACRAGEEQYCIPGASFTYNSTEQDKVTPTYGGYSKQIVVDEKYLLRVPAGLALDAAAPLLCAGITTYSPLMHFGVKRGDRVGIVGLGGLGHMGVKFAHALGAHTTVLSHSPGKREDALRLGADDFIAARDPQVFEDNKARFDFILDTVSAPHDYNSYLNLLRLNGTMVLVGIPDPQVLDARSMIGNRRRLAGSMIGGIRETQEMLEFCGKHNIVSDIELIPMQKINEAYERTVKSDVRYRFVIDIAGSLK